MVNSGGFRAPERVLSVVVTYFPNPGSLNTLLESIRHQTAHCMVIDNGSSFDFSALRSAFPPTWLTVNRLDANAGIAKAQNIGIQHARREGFDHVLLFDQDSRPAVDMVEKLLAAHRELKNAGIMIAGVGPVFLDRRSGPSCPFITCHYGWLRRGDCADSAALVRSDHLISSGCLISVESLHGIGDMDERLFIDSVDIEWGLRAKRLGYTCFGVCAATMEHALGDYHVKFLGKSLSIRSPLRHYYMVRNALWLSGQSSIPWAWRFVLMRRGLRYLLLYGLIARPAGSHMRMMGLGVIHALRGRLGRYDG